MPIDMSLATTPPPKKNTGARSNARTKAAPASVQQDVRTVVEKRAEGLMGLGQLAQGICVLTGQYADAAAIGQFFEPIAVETAKIAENNETVGRGIDTLIAIGPYGALIAAVLPFGMQIAANHRLIDPTRAMAQGVVAPEVLESQMKTQMLQMQAEAMKQQQEAVAAARKAEAEMQAMLREQMQPQG